MSIVTLDEIKEYLAMSVADDTDDALIGYIHDGTEKLVKNTCRRALEEATHAARIYNGTGANFIYMDDYPVTAVTRVSIGRDDAIRVKNTDTTVTQSYVTVGSSSLALKKEDSGVTTTKTASFAVLDGYPTLSALVAQIAAGGGGWTSEIVSTDYNDIASTDLVQGMYVMAGGRANVTSAYIEIPMHGDPVQIEWDEDSGKLIRAAGFPKGNRNVAVWYTCGYSSTTMPDDIRNLVMEMVKGKYDKRDDAGYGKSGFTISDMTVRYQDLSETQKAVLEHHRRKLV